MPQAHISNPSRANQPRAVVDVSAFASRRLRARAPRGRAETADDTATETIALELTATPAALSRLMSALGEGRHRFVLTEVDGSISVRATVVESSDTRSPVSATVRKSQLVDAWIDWENGSLERRKHCTVLSWTERRLLACLIEHEGAAVTHRQLIAAGWPRARATVSQNLLGVYMHYLRRRFASVGLNGIIKTVRRTGYTLDTQQCPAERIAGD